MSTSTTAKTDEMPVEKATAPAASVDKGKGKSKSTEEAEEAMEEDEEDDDDEEEDDEEDEEEEDDNMDEAEKIDSSKILPPGTRRSTRAKVDYSSAEAMAKAGVKPEEHDDEREESFTMKED